MGEQKAITITVDEYKKAIAEMTRLDMLREELIAIRGTYIDEEDQIRLLRLAGITETDEEIVTKTQEDKEDTSNE